MNTVNEAIEFYNNIRHMLTFDKDAMKSYLIRLWFENTPMNEGAKTETEKLHRALGLIIEECEKNPDVELLRMGAMFGGILKSLSKEAA